MEQKDKDKRSDNSPSNSEMSPIDRIETPFPAQEIFPIEQSHNDGKQKNDMERLRENIDRNEV